MRKGAVLSVLCLLLCMFAVPVLASGQVVGEKALIDTAYDKNFVVSLDDWFNTHRLAAGATTRGDKVFESPRSQLLLLTNKGSLIGFHYHESADEIVYIYKGKGEMYIDGKWVSVKAGDLHINPRGTIHATQPASDDEMLVFSVFTPPQAKGNDRVMYGKENPLAEGQGVGNPGLIDTKYDKGMVIDLDKWYGEHLLKQGAATRGDVVFDSPRSQVVLVTNRGPLIGLHYHQSADEYVFVHKGKGEMYINGKWTPVKAGDIHVNPRGVIHATRVVGDQDMQVFSIFTPPQANGNDKVMLK